MHHSCGLRAPFQAAYSLCENYNFDRSKYRLCVKEKRFAAITRSDFAKLKEDLQFLDNAMIAMARDQLHADEIRFSELQDCDELWVDSRAILHGLPEDPYCAG